MIKYFFCLNLGDLLIFVVKKNVFLHLLENDFFFDNENDDFLYNKF